MQFNEMMGGVKMMNTTVWARSMIWVGQMQVGHNQFNERMGAVMELG